MMGFPGNMHSPINALFMSPAAYYLLSRAICKSKVLSCPNSLNQLIFCLFIIVKSLQTLRSALTTSQPAVRLLCLHGVLRNEACRLRCINSAALLKK